MSQGSNRAEAVTRRFHPWGTRVNWWGILGVLCMLASAFLSVTILVEILQALRSAGEAGLGFPGG